MTEEALADRQAALHGDAGTDESFQVDIPPKQPTDQVHYCPLIATCKVHNLLALLRMCSNIVDPMLQTLGFSVAEAECTLTWLFNHICLLCCALDVAQKSCEILPCIKVEPSVDSHGLLLVNPSIMHGHGLADGLTVL